ncbi:helix-turn-helix domain-containing protein [Planotetraspora sp. GP83]|uniref:helix-turn-helix domain-containing protein n=1 Tax=Planotetraspora sp. GP83 TaxID=3156264 RepID=UPI00351766DF
MLEALGLTGREEAVYQALLDDPAMTEAGLREVTGMATVSAVLRALQDKGLVARLAGRPTRYSAAPPEVAVEMLIRAREEELQRVRVDSLLLTERFRAARRPEGAGALVETLEGVDAVRQRWIQLQQAARHEICVLDCPPYLTQSNPVQSERHAHGVEYRVVYDTTALTVPGRLEDIESHIKHGEHARVASDVPVKLLLADDHVGMISLWRPATADSVMIIHSLSLLTALRALFESVWNRASPYSLAGDPLGGDDRRLLTLLAAGMTDESIARQLGWHPRTVQRRVRRLMDTLGVRTRFQAGMHAQREGWL